MASATKFEAEQIRRYGATFERMMVAYDFSAFAESALACALNIAESFRSEIILVYASADTGGTGGDLHALRCAQAEASEQLESAARRVRDLGLRCGVICRIGSPADVLSQIAVEIKPDLLVLGAYGHHRNHHRLGSTAEFSMRSMPCATLTIGPRAIFKGTDGWRIGKILYASSLPSQPTAAMNLTRAIAVALGAGVDVVHVLPSKAQHGRSREVNISELEAMGDSVATHFKRHGIQACSKLVEPPAAKSILAHANAIGAGLIVFGVEHKALDEKTFGMMSEVLQGASCPLLTVPGPA